LENLDSNFNLSSCIRLKNFSISFIAIILGLTGFALAFLKAETILGLPLLSPYLLKFAVIMFGIVSIIYLTKLVFFPKEVKKELSHPIKLNFFPILAKILLVLSIIFLGVNLMASKYLWWAGVIVQFAFSIIILSAWISHKKFEIHHINPAWFMPIVGNLIIPIAGITHFSAELSWFFFSIGIVWWLVLFVIIINRIIFHGPISDKLIPTTFILFAPPAIAFISYVKLTGGITPFAKILYYFAIFIFILVMAQIKAFTRIKFYLSWWAYSFPVVALTVATLLMYHETKLGFFKFFSWGLLIFLHIIMVLLILKTAIAIKRKEICIEED